MSVIIRLQNLAWSANASDIREFFKGLNVPEGGVHIVGGEMGDAFIAFSTDEDARLGMMKSGEVLKGVQITLSLSSRTQMQKVIETARQQVMGASYNIPPQPAPVPTPQALPFNQVNQTVVPTPPPVMQTMPVQVQHDPKPPSIYRPPDVNPAQNLAQPFPNQMAQYPPMFPGATVMKPPGIGENLQSASGGSMIPANQMRGQYYDNQNIPPDKSFGEKINTPNTEKQNQENDKKDRKSDRDRKDRDSRDDRRRRSKSRSRSRERRRRHRSRSRDRSSRYRRSRSRDRDRGKDKDRRDRDKRSSREQREQRSQDISERKSLPPVKDGIPGLGDIPTEIPKDKINIVTPNLNEPVTRTTPHSRWGGFQKLPEQDIRQTVDMEIEPIDMELDKNSQDRHLSPQIQKTLPGMRQSSQERLHPIQENIFPPQNGRSGIMDTPALKCDLNFGGPRFAINMPADSFRAAGSNDRNFHPDRRTFGAPFMDMNNRTGPGPGSNFEDRTESSQRNFYPPRQNNSWNEPARDPRNFDAPRDENSVVDDIWKINGPREESQYRPGGWNERTGQERFSSQEFRGTDQRNSYDRGGHRGRRGLGPDSGRGGGNFHDQGSGYQEERGDFRGLWGRGFNRGRGMGNTGPEGIRERKPRTRCIEILNIPFNASYKAVRDLFYGIAIPGGTIKILPDEDGNRSTTALMRFETTVDAYEAFKRRFSYIGDSQIEINFIDETRYENSRDFMQDSNQPRKRPTNQSINDKNCLKIIGFPEATNDSDIAQIFAEFQIRNIVLERSNDDKGKFNGCGYVKFTAISEAELALKKLQGVTLDGNYLEGNLCSENIMQKVVEIQREHPISETRGQQREHPISETRGQQREHPISDTRGQQREHPISQTRGQELIISETREQEHPISETRDQNRGQQRDNMDQKQIPSSENSQKPAISNKCSLTQGADLLTDSVIIKNVPRDLSQSVIDDFFSAKGIITEKIHFGNVSSDNTCDVYVVFPQIENAHKAVLKTGEMLGPIKAKIELISKPSVMNALGLPFDPLELFKKSNKSNVNISKGAPGGDQELFRKSVPVDAPVMENRRIEPLTNIRNIGPPEHSHMNDYPRDRPGSMNDHHRVHISDHQRSRSGTDHINEHPRNRPPFSVYGQESSHRPVPNTVAPDHFGRAGCVVALENVPYSATTDDIIQFFAGYPITPDCVIRRYDEFNRPTSDARVALPNSETTIRALNTLHRQYIMNRPINVTLIN